MSPAQLHLTSGPGTVWRVGHAPRIWDWTPWTYATDNGLFAGRWDDQRGEFRTLYTSASLLGCFLELLAVFRPSPIEADLAAIVDDDDSVSRYPDIPAGHVGHRWLDDRAYGQAELTGTYCFITHTDSLGALQSRFPFHAFGYAPSQVDTSLLKDGNVRTLTRSIARWLYDARDADGIETADGIEFRSRFGDDIALWAVFERAGDGESSTHLHPAGDTRPVTDDQPELLAAFALHGLSWAD